MPSNVTWFDDSKTIAYQRIYGRWTVQETLEAISEAETNMLDAETSVPSYFIIDLSTAEGVPGGILGKQAKYTEITDETSFTVIVGAHEIIRVFVQSMQRFGFNREIVFAKTIDEAVLLIEAQKSQSEEV